MRYTTESIIFISLLLLLLELVYSQCTFPSINIYAIRYLILLCMFHSDLTNNILFICFLFPYSAPFKVTYNKSPMRFVLEHRQKNNTKRNCFIAGSIANFVNPNTRCFEYVQVRERSDRKKLVECLNIQKFHKWFMNNNIVPHLFEP